MMLSMAAISTRMSSQRRMLVTIVGCAHRIWVLFGTTNRCTG